LRGRAIWNWDNRDNAEQSIRYFEKAVAADPDYALAWGYLAFARMASMPWRLFVDVGRDTIEAYDRALAIDPGQSEALATKALMTQLLKKDWDGAGNLYKQAMAARDNINAIMLYASL
jgi:Tfp pilus assembly protein PilF